MRTFDAVGDTAKESFRARSVSYEVFQSFHEQYKSLVSGCTAEGSSEKRLKGRKCVMDCDYKLLRPVMVTVTSLILNLWCRE